MGKFIVSTRSNGEFQFRLLADNNQTILSSEGYSSKASCLAGIESVRNNSTDATRYESADSSNGKFYFRLKAGNGQTIASSEMYETSSGRDNGIGSVQRNAPDATVDDQSAVG